MTTQLFIYNEALGHLGERTLASLSENREPKRVLDSYWADVVQYALLQGLWRFARRTVSIDTSTTIIPAFGFNNAFNYPNDWLRTQIVSTSPDLDPPLVQYRDENNFIYANATPLYVSYISNDPQYGLNLGIWPENFTDYVGLRLARYACLRLTNDKELKADLTKAEDKARRTAKASDAENDPPGLPPVPYWARARRGAFGPGGLWFGSGGSGGTGEN
jgi:hypothetical protein